MEPDAVVSRRPAQELERVADIERETLREHALRLLDEDAGVERALEVGVVLRQGDDEVFQSLLSTGEAVTVPVARDLH